tara:strand:- start:43937 stop:44869 length:933 start_codon:yes stop_codon:yes gene_type:complete
MFGIFSKKNKDSKASSALKPYTFPTVAADGFLEFSDLAEITGNIGDNAKIKITGCGGLLVRGNVGNNVEIIVKNGTGMSSILNIVIRNGKGAKRYDDKVFEGNVIIEGHCGDDVSIDTHGDIHVNTVGNMLTAKAGHEFTAQRLGDYATITSCFDTKIQGESGERTIITTGHSVKTGDIGDNSEINAGFDIKCANIGAYSECEAGHRIKLKSTGEHCVLEAGFDIKIDNLGTSSSAESGHNFKAALIGDSCRVQAGFDIKATKAFNNAVLDCSFSAKIDSYIDAPSQAETKADAATENKSGKTPPNFDIM